MEPMNGLEPLTYALRMGTKKLMKMIDKALVIFLTIDSGALSFSFAILYSSRLVHRPDFRRTSM